MSTALRSPRLCATRSRRRPSRHSTHRTGGALAQGEPAPRPRAGIRLCASRAAEAQRLGVEAVLRLLDRP
ncbi:hypothetical protein ACFPRL_03140 [Pseudoclavibacter helvolus]